MPESLIKMVKSWALSHALWDILKYTLLLAMTTAWSWLLAAVLAARFSRVQEVRHAFITACVVSFGTAALVVYHRVRRNRPHFGKLDLDFHVIEKVIHYEYHTRTRMTYTKHCKLRALRRGLDKYTDKYHWTGQGSLQMRSGIPDHRVRETGRKNVWTFYEVSFPKVLAKGESVDVDVIWSLDDEAGVAVPFLSSTVEEPTDKLVLSATLPPALGVKKVTCESSSHTGATHPFTSEVAELNPHGEVSWTIPIPKLLHHYEMRWSWN